MIFSIIIVIFIIGISVYAITTFLQLGKTTEISLFYQRFQETVDDVWSSATTNKVISLSLPKSIELVCLGSLLTTGTNEYVSKMNVLKEYSSGFQQQNTNTFLYPPQKAGDFAFKKVDKIDVSSLNRGFDCFEVKNGVVKIRLSKSEFDSLVKIQHE